MGTLHLFDKYVLSGSPVNPFARAKIPEKRPAAAMGEITDKNSCSPPIAKRLKQTEKNTTGIPLAERMRPETLEAGNNLIHMDKLLHI